MGLTYVERLLKSRTRFTSKKYPVIWAATKRERQTKYIGICGKTWKPCFFTTEAFVALVTKDVYTDIDFCQSEDRCLNTHCNLNRTTPESLSQIKQMGPKESKQLQENWEKVTENFSKRHSYEAETCKKEFDARGGGGIFWLKTKSKRKPAAEKP